MTTGYWGPNAIKGAEYIEDVRNGATMTTVTATHFLDAFIALFGEFANLSAQMAIQHPVLPAPTDEDPTAVITRTSEDSLLVHASTTGGIQASFAFRGGEASAGVDGFRWEVYGSKGSVVVKGARGNPGANPPRLWVNGEEIEVEEGMTAVGREYVEFLDGRDGMGFELAVVRLRMIEAIYESARTGRRTSYL
jgi:predicted dehydrogenase